MHQRASCTRSLPMPEVLKCPQAAELAANPVGQGLLAALPPPKAFSETASERNLLLPRLFLNR